MLSQNSGTSPTDKLEEFLSTQNLENLPFDESVESIYKELSERPENKFSTFMFAIASFFSEKSKEIFKTLEVLEGTKYFNEVYVVHDHFSTFTDILMDFLNDNRTMTSTIDLKTYWDAEQRSSSNEKVLMEQLYKFEKIVPSINHRKTKEICEDAYKILKKFRASNALLKFRFEKEYGILDWKYPKYNIWQ